MRDWQHELRNELNLMLYASSTARDALAQGQPRDVLDGLDRIDTAIVHCSSLLDRLAGQARAVPPGAAASRDEGSAPAA